jgi:hypothetical protein
VKHRDVDHGVEETGLGSYTPKIEAAPKAVADAKHRSWEAAVASAIEEINNGIPTTADILRPPEGGSSAQRTTRRLSVFFDVALVRHQLAVVRRVNTRLADLIALARHAGPARAAQVLVLSEVRMDFAHPPYAKAFGAVLIHAHRLSGVRSGLDLSSLSSSCLARL